MPQLQESKMITCSVRYETHLSDKADSSEAQPKAENCFLEFSYRLSGWKLLH